MRRFAKTLSIGILAVIPVLAAPTAFASTMSHAATTSRITSVSPKEADATWHWAEYSKYIGLAACQEQGNFYLSFPNIAYYQCTYSSGSSWLKIYQLWLYIYS
jgi:hypothetical protein